MATRHWLTLATTRGLGPVLVRRLAEACGGVEAACSASAAQLSQIPGIGKGRAATLASSIKSAAREADREIDAAHQAGVAVVSPDDDQYPPLLIDLPDAPPVLWVWGELEPRDLNAVAIVGSRRPSRYGQEQASRFGSLLAGAGFTVVSGGAYGVDARAHRGALAAVGGRTVAVLGCGVDVAYPPENGPMLADVADGHGAVVSEWPMGTGPRKEHFPRRNRVISGMSRGVLVIEAAERSGALITARVAADDHNRPVFALPGRVDNEMSAGPHGLLRDGAFLAATLEDVTANLGPLPSRVYPAQRPAAAETLFNDEFPKSPDAPPPMPALSDGDRQLLDALDGEAVGVDALCDRTGLPAHRVQSALTLMSLKGLVRRVGNRFERK